MGFEHPGLYWLIIGVTLALLELAMPVVVLIFFGAGALVTALVCTIFPQLAVLWQLILFLLTSLLALALLRGVLLRRFLARSPEETAQEAGDLALARPGEKATVTVAVVPPASGQIRYGGTFWSATADEELSVGQIVEIVRQENLTMRVKRCKA